MSCNADSPRAAVANKPTTAAAAAAVIKGRDGERSV